MTDETLPDPLVPAEVDLSDFGFMPLDVRRLLTSETWIEAADDPRIGHAAMSLWAESWHQVPCGSLPDNDRVLLRLSMCPSMKEWARVRDRVLKGWVRCSDNRLYHPVVAEKARESWARKLAQRERTRLATEARERKRRERETERDVQRNEARNVQRDEQRDEQRDDQRQTNRDVHQGTGIGIGIGTGTVKPKSKTAEPPSADAARTPRPPDPVKDEIWRAGREILEAEGMNRDRAGSYLGKLCKEFGNPLVLHAIRDCQATTPAKPSEWLYARCQERRTSRSETLGERNARAVADWVPPEMRDAAS